MAYLMSFFAILVTEVFLTVPPLKPGIGLYLENTSMRVIPDPQIRQIQIYIYYIYYQTTFFLKLQTVITPEPLEPLS